MPSTDGVDLGCFTVVLDLPQLLRDPLWQFAGVVLTSLAILVAIVVYRKQRKIKSLDCKVLSATPLLTVKEELEGKLQVLYESRPIKSAHLVMIEFKNSGTDPILPGDFIQPLGVTFGSESKLLTSEIVETFPTESSPIVTTTAGGLVVTPLLINQGDFLRAKCLVENYAGSVRPSGRIVGVREIGMEMPDETLPGSLLLVFLLIGLSGSMGGFALLDQAFPLSLAQIITGYFFFALALLGATSGATARWVRAAVLSEPKEAPRKQRALPRSDAKDFDVLFARYGADNTWRDVTAALRMKVRDGTLKFAVLNEELGGDPVPNVAKRLELTYSQGGGTYSKTASESEVLSLP